MSTWTDLEAAMTTRTYGWRRDTRDYRDLFWAPQAAKAAKVPLVVDLTATCPPVVDQGQLGSCTANGVEGAVGYDMRKQALPFFPLSRLFEYYNSRALEGTVKQDAGATIRDAMKALAANGYCPETDWPYVVNKFATKPPAKAYTDALKHRPIQYQAVVQSLGQIEACLASGLPIVFGFDVYASFESDAVAKTGIVPMPKKGEALLGGHCVVLCGYSHTAQTFLVRNSWGASWGQKGYCVFPYAYLLGSMASDFWTCTHVV
jgi:C1A family cysteine protease